MAIEQAKGSSLLHQLKISAEEKYVLIFWK
jgi:hypothetical protein